MTALAQHEVLETPRTAVSSSDGSTSVLKALQLMDAFRNGSRLLGVSDLSRRAGIHKSTAFRLLATLERGGYVERVGTKYQLSLRVFEMGNRVELCKPSGLRDVALPFLSELYATVNRTVHLGVLDGGEVLYLEKIHGHRAKRLPTTIGGRMPANCTAIGKAMLAFSDKETVMAVLDQPLTRMTPYSNNHPGRLVSQLHQIQVDGIAHDREEVALGLICVAAPILRRGRAVAAISVSSPTAGFNETLVGEQVRAAAQGISAAMFE